MLVLDGVTFRYPGADSPAVRDIDLELAGGEVVGLVGPQEAGKSTLCLIASGLAPRSVGGTLAGRLVIDGRDMASAPMHDVAAVVGVCFQNPSSQLSQVSDTVFEEVAFGALNLGLERLEVARRTAAALRSLEIEHLAHRDPRRLSGGQMQLVAVCGLLAMQPGHLILDEPTAQLDPQGKELVARALGRLAAAGSSLLVAEHDTDLLAAISQRVIVVEGGRLTANGSTGDVLGAPDLEQRGVTPPSPVLLRRRLHQAGLDVEVPV